ncbi:HD domain-containing protein [Streptomyces sp. Marseille-Q5077]|uniref:HD domain-containing protein n=1 Tax=Streptomyces sp. Marseille-Q5077 TaxID=3418995 RepID=UPI003CFDF7D3
MGSVGNARTTSGRRRALLIGITDTPDLHEVRDLAERYPRLDGAPQDVELIGSALKRSGYEITTRLDGIGLARLQGALNAFFTSCEPGDTAFVYVSCHGTSVGDHDYLLPYDAQPGGLREDGTQGLLTATLVEAEPGTMLRGLRPGVTAVVCIDACRAEEEDPDQEKPQDRWASYELDALWLYGCGPGQVAYADPAEGSLFARVLAEALQPNSPPTTFADVVEYTGQALRRQAGSAPGLQTPAPYVPSRLRDRTGEIVLCAGSEDTLRWTEAVRACELWDHTAGSPAVHERVKQRLGDLIRYVVDSCAGAGAHADDPWNDPAYPERLVRRLDDLVRRASLRPGDFLSPAETACLLAGPFVHEGIVAVALQDLRIHQPLHLGASTAVESSDSNPHGRQVRGAAQDVCRAHSQVQRTAGTLRARGLDDAARAADHWLRHRLIADWDALWERDGAYPAVDAILAKAVDAVVVAAEDPTAGPRTEVARREVDDQVRQVLGHFTVNPGGADNGPRVNVPGRGDGWNISQPVRDNTWRAPWLARLLWAAALLAADPRRLSSVLVDHLGAHEPLRPQDVVSALAYDFDYAQTGGRTTATHGVDVRFSCPHPALHAAVEELVGHADATVRTVHREWNLTGLPPLLKGLPDRVTAENLTPRNQHYRRPLERFRLAEDEIRPLLMGTQLYGDRMLAVRELYQNALDACRYRHMRRLYGATQADCGSRANWTPRISFTQGWDSDGRPYIECEDNGTGMTRAKVTSMFARAGKRYEQDPGFVQERRNWRRAGIEDIGMNSRFGIGVFSYFMLADEVVVWTRPVDRHGLPGSSHPLRADIQSGSGLLRVSDAPDAPELGGTRVRLYLAAHEDKQPSLVEALRSILWVSDFEVTAEERDQGDPGRVARSATWAPGRLTANGSWAGQPARAGRDAWLVQGKGQLLLDGVVVKNAPAVHGRVFNLRERHAPEPSVDRNDMLSFDEELVMRELLAGVPEAAVQWSEVPLSWLWRLSHQAPRLAVAVLAALPDSTTAVLESGPGDQALVLERLSLSDVGCLPIDQALLHERTDALPSSYSHADESSLVRDWQATRLSLSGLLGHVFRPAGYPDPAPLDALLFLEKPTRTQGWLAALRAAAMNRISLRESVRVLRRYAVMGIYVPAVDDVNRLNDIRPSKTDVSLYSLYRRPRPRPGRGSAALHAPLVLLSAHQGLTYGTLSARLEQLGSLDPDLPQPPELPPELRGECASGVASRLAFSSYSESPDWILRAEWQPGAVSPLDLLDRADPTFPIEELIAQTRHLAPLGFSFSSEPTGATLSHGRLKDSERHLLSNGPRSKQFLRGAFSMIELFGISARLHTPLGEVAKRINDIAAATGVEAPDVPADAADFVVPEWVADSLRYRSAGPFGPWSLVTAAVGHPSRQAVTDTELRGALPVLQTCGLLRRDLTWDFEAVVREVESGSPVVELLGSSASALDAEELDLPKVIMGMRSIGEQLDQLAETPKHLELPGIPQITSPAVRSLRFEPGDERLLMKLNLGTGRTFRDELSINDLFRHCLVADTALAPALRRLTRFTVIDAPQPPGDFTGPDTEALEDFRPDRLDLAAFGAGLLGPGTLGPLELVLLAGRFGRTLGEVYERYAPFRCLGLEVTVAEPNAEEAELSPGWQEVIVLTVQLTGRAPALSGTVHPDHIVLCAEETDLTEPQIRKLLEHYGRLFGLRLPGGPDGLNREDPRT